MTISYISKVIVPIVSEFHVEPPRAEGTKTCSNSLGHMTNMATLSISGIHLYKSSYPEPIER